MVDTNLCSECGAEILVQTAQKTGGRCLPCTNGTRQAIEEGKRWAADRRRQEREIAEGLARIADLSQPTFGDFLKEADPIAVLWPFIVDSVFVGDPKVERLECLTDPAKVLYLVQVLDGEVINGGFSQFFSNTAGRHAHATLGALKEINFGCVDLLERAISAFPANVVPTDRRLRCELLQKHEDSNRHFWDALDKEYYSRVDGSQQGSSDDLAHLLIEFARRHATSAIRA